MFKLRTVNKIFTKLAHNNPKPKIELDYLNGYTLLIAVVLSAQSTDKSVNRVTAKLFKIADNPQTMIELGEAQLKQCIRSLGLYNNKSRNIIALSNILLEKYNGNIPDNLSELMQLPGVGRKSANVIMNSFFGQPTIGVDTHVHRVSNRIGLVNTKTPIATERALLKIIPENFMLHAHHWLVLHGRYICKARKPMCDDCIINDLCARNFTNRKS